MRKVTEHDITVRHSQ